MKRIVAMLVAGGILALGPVWGLLGSSIGMVLAFDNLSSAGPQKDAALANNISLALLSTIGGMVACPVGVVLLVIGLVMLVKRSKAEEARRTGPPAHADES